MVNDPSSHSGPGRWRLIDRWLSANGNVDIILSLSAGVLAFALSFVDTGWRRRLTDGILNDAIWPDYMQTLSGVSAALVGFGATAIAIILALAAGQQGKRVLTLAGTELSRVLTKCLSSMVGISMAFAIAGGLKPSEWSLPLGVILAALLVLMILRLSRLWYFLRRLLEVFVRDSATASVGHSDIS